MALDLEAIEARAKKVSERGVSLSPSSAQLLADVDVPALIAEVRRLEAAAAAWRAAAGANGRAAIGATNEPSYSTEAVDALLAKWDLYCAQDEETEDYVINNFINAVRASREPAK